MRVHLWAGLVAAIVCAGDAVAQATALTQRHA